MDAGASLIADVEASESMQPGQRAFDDPARLPEAAAVRRPALRQLGPNPPSVQLVTMGLGIVAAVALDTRGLMAGPAGPAARTRSLRPDRHSLRVAGGRPVADAPEGNGVRIREHLLAAARAVAARRGLGPPA